MILAASQALWEAPSRPYSVRVHNSNGASYSNLPQSGSISLSYKAVSQLQIL